MESRKSDEGMHMNTPKPVWRLTCHTAVLRRAATLFGTRAVRYAEEYIEEAEHQEGKLWYWTQFDSANQVQEDFEMYCTEAGYFGDIHDERIQEAISDLAGSLYESKDLMIQTVLRDDPTHREMLFEDQWGEWYRVSLTLEHYTPRPYDVPAEKWETDQGCDELYRPKMYRICNQCGRVEVLGYLDEIVEETGRTYEWRGVRFGNTIYQMAVSLEDPSFCEQCRFSNQHMIARERLEEWK